MDFNCLNLVVSADSWVAVLDFFGVAGDDLPQEEAGPEPQQTGNMLNIEIGNFVIFVRMDVYIACKDTTLLYLRTQTSIIHFYFIIISSDEFYYSKKHF